MARRIHRCLPPNKGLIRVLGFVLAVIGLLSSCIKKADQSTLQALEILYVIRTQPSISCYYSASDGTEYCLQNPNISTNLGSTCQFQPILVDGARTVYNSYSTCQALGFPNCTTITSGTNSYEKCSR